VTTLPLVNMVSFTYMTWCISTDHAEKLVLATKTTARKELILLHDERTVAPGSTRLWLKNRPYIHAHHHVELPGVITPHKGNLTVHDPAAVAAFKHLRERVETRIKKYRGLRPLRPRRPAHMNDFARIARRLTGKQIGVVLGGGGARGISHIGFLQALEEYGIPVDEIGGCAIGSCVGGLYARETDLLETTGRTKQFAGRMGSMLRLLSDVTYPFVAYTTGHEFSECDG
jgi:lysophospholipid hydrolase